MGPCSLRTDGERKDGKREGMADGERGERGGPREGDG